MVIPWPEPTSGLRVCPLIIKYIVHATLRLEYASVDVSEPAEEPSIQEMCCFMGSTTGNKFAQVVFLSKKSLTKTLPFSLSYRVNPISY